MLEDELTIPTYVRLYGRIMIVLWNTVELTSIYEINVSDMPYGTSVFGNCKKKVIDLLINAIPFSFAIRIQTQRLRQ